MSKDKEALKLDMARVKKEAADELRKEKLEEAKQRAKDLLREIADAKKVVTNLERELEDYYAELEQDS